MPFCQKYWLSLFAYTCNFICICHLSETLDIYNMWYRKQGLSVHLNLFFQRKKIIWNLLQPHISTSIHVTWNFINVCIQSLHLTFYKTRTLWPTFIEIDISVLFSYCHLHKPEFHQTNVTVHASYLSRSAPTKLGHCDLFSQKLYQLQWLSWMDIQLVIRKLWVQPLLGWQHSFVEIDHEIFSTVILSLPLIQEGKLSVLAKEYAQILVNGFEDSKPAQ